MGVVRQTVLQSASLVATVGLRTIKSVNFADAATGQLFNDPTEFDKHIAQLFGQTLAQGGLARTAQANERNVLARCQAGLRGLFEQAHQVALQGFGHLQQHQDGGVAHAGLQIRPVPLGHLRTGRGRFA